jgi:PleD family two-component response regulator
MTADEFNLLVLLSSADRVDLFKPKLAWARSVQFAESACALRKFVKVSPAISGIVAELVDDDTKIVSKILTIYPLIPVVIASSHFDENLAIGAFEAGASDFLAPLETISADAFERALKSANLRMRAERRGAIMLERLELVALRARELACGITGNKSAGAVRPFNGNGKIAGAL